MLDFLAERKTFHVKELEYIEARIVEFLAFKECGDSPESHTLKPQQEYNELFLVMAKCEKCGYKTTLSINKIKETL